MTENRPAAVTHDAAYYRAQRVPACPPPTPIGESARQIEAPRIRHYAGPHRPIVTTAPAKPIRVTREDIERALGGSFTYSPHTEEIVDRIVLETLRMDGFAEGSPPFMEHQQMVLRLLRELGLYPV